MCTTAGRLHCLPRTFRADWRWPRTAASIGPSSMTGAICRVRITPEEYAIRAAISQQAGQWEQALLHQFVGYDMVAGPSPRRDEAVTGMCTLCPLTLNTVLRMRTVCTLCTLHRPETLKWAYVGKKIISWR